METAAIIFTNASLVWFGFPGKWFVSSERT